MDWDISSKFGKQMDIHLLKRLPLRNLNPEVNFRFYGRHLEKSIWRHTSAASRRIATKLGSRMQNDISITIHRYKSKPEIQFKYGGLRFSETGSSFVSVVHWDISSKFGMQIVIHFLKQVMSVNLNTEVAFGLYGRHLEKSILRHNSPAIVWLRQNLACWCKITCRWPHLGQNWNKR